MKKFKALKILFILFVGFSLAIIFYLNSLFFVPPKVDESLLSKITINQIEKNFYKSGKNWFKKSSLGLWELYVAGTPFERGVTIGKLTKKHIYDQENSFVKELHKNIPSVIQRNFLKVFVLWFNRDLDNYFMDEYKKELYGISLSSSSEFSNLGSGYHRLVNYHSAHDIGHSLLNMNLVQCTSFAVWNKMSKSGNLLLGRNFDFYVGDEFAKEKIVAFYAPAKGYKFIIVTWGGMIGAVSGMNEKGLTITLNSAVSHLYFGVGTPVSILAREIIQYAKNIDQAFEIAKKRKVFVSELFLIGSNLDGKASIIEKTVNKTTLYHSPKDYIIASNHFQSKELKNSKLNLKHIKNSHSKYRYDRMEELLTINKPIDYKKASNIMRERSGIKGKNLGMGNEKAINQLRAHHSILFDPVQKIFWVSVYPYQLGKYVAYRFDKVFQIAPFLKKKIEIYEKDLTIQEDPFLFSKDYEDYKRFQKITKLILKEINSKNRSPFNKTLVNKFIKTNPDYFQTYELSGDYYSKHRQYFKALDLFKKALELEISTTKEIKRIQEKIDKLNELISKENKK